MNWGVSPESHISQEMSMKHISLLRTSDQETTTEFHPQNLQGLPLGARINNIRGEIANRKKKKKGGNSKRSDERDRKRELTLGSSPKPYIMCCTGIERDHVSTIIIGQKVKERESWEERDGRESIRSFWKMPRLRLEELSEGWEEEEPRAFPDEDAFILSPLRSQPCCEQSLIDYTLS